MKKLLAFCAAAIIFVAATVWAVDNIHVANGVQVKWDAVTTYGDGLPISPTDGTVEYEIVYANMDKSNPQVLWRGPETQAAVTLSQKGEFLLGIKSILVYNGTDVAESAYGWTDDPTIVNPIDGTFSVVYFPVLNTVTGMTLVK